MKDKELCECCGKSAVIMTGVARYCNSCSLSHNKKTKRIGALTAKIKHLELKLFKVDPPIKNAE